MFILYANKTKLAVRQREPTTSGLVNVYKARFEFSPDWEGLTRTAVFRAGGESRSVPLDESGTCEVPREVLAKSGVILQAGAYGTRGSEIVLPTIWADLGTVQVGVTTGKDPQQPTPALWEQELAGKGDRLDYTEAGDLGLYAGDKLLSAVAAQGGGVTDHQLLSNRDAEGQHPIESITGLKETLSKTMTTGNSLSVSEILKIMEVS